MKYVLYILLPVILMACTATGKETKPAKETANVSLVKEVYNRFNRHDWKGMAELYAPTAEFKDPSFGPGVVKQTREEMAKKYSELEQVFPDIKDEVLSVYPSGENVVIVEFISTGTAPDGSRLHLPICTIFTIENELIVKDYTYYDNSKG